MFIIFGRRTARIKKYTENREYCRNCHSFDLSVFVYKEYFHIFFLPIFSFGPKTAKIYCNNCVQPFRNYSTQTHYENIARTPIYLYSGLILFVTLILVIINLNIKTQKEKAKFIESPKIGDVYRMRKIEKNSTSYYFLRISRIKDDTVFTYHNNFIYGGFITGLSEDDFFVKNEELIFTKKELKELLGKGEINSVERHYTDSEGFNRIK